MSKPQILAEIKRLEALKADNPSIAVSINAEITKQCDRLKGLGKWKPRKVV